MDLVLAAANALFELSHKRGTRLNHLLLMPSGDTISAVAENESFASNSLVFDILSNFSC
jgi:hypothetical protein